MAASPRDLEQPAELPADDLIQHGDDMAASPRDVEQPAELPIDNLIQHGDQLLTLLKPGTGGGTTALKKFLDTAPTDVVNYADGAPLHQCCQQKHSKFAKVLIDTNKCDLEARTSGRTPLMTASGAGCLEIVEMLLAAGAHVNAVTTSGNTALVDAISFPVVVKFLLAAGADHTMTNAAGRTPLEQAKMPNPMGSNAEDRARSALMLRECETQDLLARVAARRASDTSGGAQGKALFEAAKAGDAAEAKRLLLAAEADFSWKEAEKKRGALWIACRMGRAEIAELLLDAGAAVDDADADGATPLIAAAQYGHRTCVELCQLRGSDLAAATKKGFTPLLTAIYHRQHALALWLLDLPGVASTADGKKAQGKTALEWAKMVARAAPSEAAKQLVAALEKSATPAAPTPVAAPAPDAPAPPVPAPAAEQEPMPPWTTPGRKFMYSDPSGAEHGPFDGAMLLDWFTKGMLPRNLTARPVEPDDEVALAAVSVS